MRYVEIILFIVPFVVFAAWRMTATVAGGPSPRVIAASAALVALLFAALLWFHREGALPPRHGLCPRHAARRPHRPRPRRRAMTEAPALTIEPPGFLSDPALASVLAALPEARIAGGAVRDTLVEAPGRRHRPRHAATAGRR